MHPNQSFAWTDEAEILNFFRHQGFARIFAQTKHGPRVAHVPVLVRDGPVLHFHLANGNALTAQIDGLNALALVEGPNAYLSANWYDDISGAVPSWNYIAAECEGVVRRLDRDALIRLVDDLSLHLEPKVRENWTREKMDPARFEALLGAIKAFELRIDHVRGTRKLSQHKPDGEVKGLLVGMDANGATAMADAMRNARS
jgi:transcriptional regulator